MGSMLAWSQIWGTRTPRTYVLLLTAAIFLLITPTQLYDISFQLSFLAFYFVVVALHFWQGRTPGERRRGPVGRMVEAAGFNLMTTLLISLGLWPVIAHTFGQISLLVFAGNLLMIPLLSLVVLPSGLVALVVSFAHLGRMPGGWIESIAFGWLDWVLAGWLWIVHLIDRLGAWLVFGVKLNWGPREFFLYYLLLAGALGLAARFFPAASRGDISASRRRGSVG